MEDRRRRRKNTDQSDSEGSEDGEAAFAEKKGQKTSECESESAGAEEGSEYESATETYDDDETDTYDEETATEAGTEYTEDDVIHEGEYDEGWIEERQSGDGEEQPDDNEEKNLDDDEDRKNPAYIPRKGAFYEHDNRLGEEVKDGASEEKSKMDEPEPNTKKLWVGHEKWLHDRYNDDAQKPKSRDEIIALYGYDIRARSEPPEAPPRRGGGRGRRGNRSERKNQIRDFIKVSPQGQDYQNQGRTYSNSMRNEQGYSQGNYRKPQQNSYQDDSSLNYRNTYPDSDQYSRGQSYSKLRGSGSRGRGGRGSMNNRYEGSPSPRYSNRGQGDRAAHYNQPSPPSRHEQQNYPRDDGYQDRRPQSNEKPRPYSNKQEGREENTATATTIIDDSEYLDEDIIPPMTTLYTSTTNTRTQAASSGAGQRKGGYSSRDRDKTPTPEDSKKPQRRVLAHGYSEDDLYDIMPPMTTTMTSSRPPPPKPSSENTGDYSKNQADVTTSYSSHSQGGRPTKRYSSQRQRNPPESSYQDTGSSSSPMPDSHRPQHTHRPPPGFYAPVYPGQQGVSSRGPPPRMISPGMRPPPRGAGSGMMRGPPPQHQKSSPRGSTPHQLGHPHPRQNMNNRPNRPPPPKGPPPGVGMYPQAMGPHQSQPMPVTTFPQSHMVQAPVASITYTMPVSTHVQSQSGTYNRPPPTSVPMSTVTMAQAPMAAPPQPLIQGQFLPSPVVNYGPPGAGPSGPFPLPGTVPIQLSTAMAPPPPEAPEGIQVRGGTTYFNQEAVPQMHQGSQEGIHVRGGTTYFNPESQTYVSVPGPQLQQSRRPKAAIPIINPQKIAAEVEAKYKQQQLQQQQQQQQQDQPVVETDTIYQDTEHSEDTITDNSSSAADKPEITSDFDTDNCDLDNLDTENAPRDCAIEEHPTESSHLSSENLVSESLFLNSDTKSMDKTEVHSISQVQDNDSKPDVPASEETICVSVAHDSCYGSSQDILDSKQGHQALETHDVKLAGSEGTPVVDNEQKEEK